MTPVLPAEKVVDLAPLIEHCACTVMLGAGQPEPTQALVCAPRLAAWAGADHSKTSETTVPVKTAAQER